MGRSDSPEIGESPGAQARGVLERLSIPARCCAVASLFLVGIELYLLTDRRLVRRPWELIAIGAIIALSLLPPVQRVVAVLTEWLRTRKGISVALIALSLWAGSCVYFHATAVRQARQFVPIYHDEFSYQIQAQMLARGRLWMPKHSLADFFDTFYVIVDPVYCSMYFPGTAMFLVPGVWLGWPIWLMPLILAGATVATAYLTFREALDGTAGLLAACMFVGLSLLRMLSTMSLSAVPSLLLGLIVLWSWLHWRRQRNAPWLILIGIASGWLLITRPVDALCFIVPTWCMILLDLRQASLSHIVRSLALLCIAAMPFGVVQLVFDHGVTGSFLQTPFGFYTDRDYPHAGYGFHDFDPKARPVSVVPQKQQYYHEYVANIIREHTPRTVLSDWMHGRLKTILREGLPDTLLVVLVPLGFLGVTSRRFVPLLLVPPLFVLLYSLHPFVIVHYLLIAAPSVVLLALLGARSLASAWPRTRRVMETLCTLLIVGITFISLPEFDRTARDSFFASTVLPVVNDSLSHLDHLPAVVLFRYSPTQVLEEEPVYNCDVAWPDEAPVIRAHDLGERNIEIFRYYAERQPQRAFYRYDRADGSLTFIGFAPQLAEGGR